MEIENPLMHCFGQRQWKLHQCTSKIRSSKNVVQNAFLSRFHNVFFFSHFLRTHFQNACFTFFQHMWKKCILKMHRKKTCEKNCILKMHLEKNVKKRHVFWKCENTCETNAFGNPAREDVGAIFISRFFWAKGSLLFGGPVPQKVWGRLPGWFVWWLVSK